MNSSLPRRDRRSIRLRGYDYSRAGAYFLTICVQNRECLFGEVVNGAMVSNGYGRVVQDEWHRTAQMRPNVNLDAFVVMPNHIHGILVITTKNDGDGTPRRGTTRRAPTPTVERFGKPTSNTVPTIVRGFKAAVTTRINRLRDTHGARVWQRNYYEHVIRDDEALRRIRQYIADNPARWPGDEDNPVSWARSGRDLE